LGFTLAEGATHVVLLNCCRKVAFTLAEVLITLGIIGVVSALTIPNLVTNYQEKVRVNQLIASYSVLTQAFDSMINDNGEVQYWGSDNLSRIAKFEELLPKYIQFIKKCSYREKGCIGEKYTRPGTSEVVPSAGPKPGYNSYLLKNGSAIKINYDAVSPCVQNLALGNKGGGDGHPGINYGSYNTTCFTFMIDINGPGKPNKVGIDSFKFFVYQDGIGPAGGAKETIWTDTFYNQCLGNDLTSTSIAEGLCTAWVIQNKNMDYLHCPEKLGWDKQSSCK